MSLDAVHIDRSVSPASSGRSSPVVNLRTRVGIDEASLRKDKSYRRYASGIERALSLFDTALQEWADYISFLGRLLKAIQAKPPGIRDVPLKAIVAKRLAQCLNPSLPSGVHQKTLEVYALIFSLLGKDGLERDLPLYLPGLSPTLSFASLSIKPNLLSLFETSILPLDPVTLRPALKAIILALLPGLEEATSEEFERTLRVLDGFRYAVGPKQEIGSHDPEAAGEQFFWQCLFLASITSSSRRQGALAYLLRNLPQLGTSSETNMKVPNSDREFKSGNDQNGVPPAIEAVSSPEPGLLIRCFVAGLRDEQLLIQRGFLDLLVTHLPLDSTVLQHKVVVEDLERLVAAAASVVIRRDMSLNRRLWTWFLGPEPSVEHHNDAPNSPSSSGSEGTITPKLGSGDVRSRYFERYGLTPLVRSICRMIESKSTIPLEKARPFRICLSLMDRWEIGVLLVPRIFLSGLESVWQYQKVATSREAFIEVLRSANVFFDGVESGLIWSELTTVIVSALDEKEHDKQAARKRLELILFTLSHFNLQEEEMLVVHIPLVILVLLIKLQPSLQNPSVQSSTDYNDLIQNALKIADRLLEMVPERAFINDPSEQARSDWNLEGRNLPLRDQEIVNKVLHFYGHFRGNLELAPPPIEANIVGVLLLGYADQMVTRELQSDYYASHVEIEIAIFDKLIHKVSSWSVLDKERVLSRIMQASDRFAAEPEKAQHFPAIAAAVSLLELICSTGASSSWVPDSQIRKIIPSLITGIWPDLSPSKPKYNVEAVRCIRRLQSISPHIQLVEGSIATLMLGNAINNPTRVVEIEGARRLATLWAHSVPAPSGSRDRRSSLVRILAGSKVQDVSIETITLARPLLLLLDSLADAQTDLFVFATNWLQSLPSINTIIDLLMSRLQALPYVKQLSINMLERSGRGRGDLLSLADDLGQCLYHLEIVSYLIRYSTNNVWQALASPIINDANELNGQVDSDLDTGMSIQIYLARISLSLLGQPDSDQTTPNFRTSALRRAAAFLLQQLLLGPSTVAYMEMNVELVLIEKLAWSIVQGDILLQISLMELVSIALRIRGNGTRSNAPDPLHRRTTSRETVRSMSRLSMSTERSEKDHNISGQSSPPPGLLDCLISGLSSEGSRPVLDNWVRFLDECLRFYPEVAIQFLIPLVDNFCTSIGSVFRNLQSNFTDSPPESLHISEPTASLISLLSGLEQALARAHDRLTTNEVGTVSVKSPEQPQGFFGTMVSGVFTSETYMSRNTTANNRLTVLLCFKDAVRVCFRIWSWGDYGVESPLRDRAASASFNYTSLRMRNRTRRILEHLFAAEALECLETLIESWHKPDTIGSGAQPSTVFNLLHVLDGSRPKNTIPAIFNAMYSRTNPTALDPVRKSTLTSDLSDINLVVFLVAYTRSLEDDAMDEIWTDCMTFLKDVLTNPLPHRQTLPKLLEFTAVLGEKVDNTNFGEQRKMRRDLGDLFVRLLTAVFTIKPLGFPQESTQSIGGDKFSHDINRPRQSLDIRKTSTPEDVVAILALILPNISKILVDSDRILATAAAISAHVIVPSIKWKTFPENMTRNTLEILYSLSRIPEASKTWRKDFGEAFNDPKFFCAASLDLAEKGWLPLLQQWTLADKDRMLDLMSRLSSPTSAGIVFGVGASSARLEADRRTQLVLRRMATLVLAAVNDGFVTNLPALQEKLVDLLTATAASSPSSTTRAEIYMLLRALVLKTSTVHMASLWPIISSELHDAILSLFPGQAHDTYNLYCVLQACKLLDALLTIAPDDFQMQEWLFITDTIDAVYRPAQWDPIALVDELAEGLDSEAKTPHNTTASLLNFTQSGNRKPLLSSIVVKSISKEDIIERILRPFFRQLSINAFESTYSMEAPDWKSCADDLLTDLFDDNTLV